MITRRARKGLAIAASAAFLGFAVPAWSPTASNVACGAHLTSNTTLTGDLVCPLGNGLSLDRITLSGNGTAADVEGVAVSVTNSRFQNNKHGIFGFYAQIAVDDSDFVANGAVNGGGGNLSIDPSIFDGIGSGELAASCSESGLKVTRSVIANYQRPVGGFDCGGVTLIGNRCVNNALAFQSSDDLISQPVKATDGEQIIGNTFTNNGIAVQSRVSGRIADNTFTANATGIITTSNSVW